MKNRKGSIPRLSQHFNLLHACNFLSLVLKLFPCGMNMSFVFLRITSLKQPSGRCFFKKVGAKEKCYHGNYLLPGLISILLPALLLPALSRAAPHSENWAYVRYVIDGDTIILQDGRKVRYIGINAPEIAHKNKPGEPFGKKATEYNRRLVQGRRVRIVPAGDKVDRFGRMLAFVYTSNNRMVNEELLKAGMAHVCFFTRNLKHRQVLLKAQLHAINFRKGIWSVKPARPEPYYIGNSKSMRFHRPSCKYGKRTSAGNRIIFKDRITACKKGYCRCKKCLP